MMFIFCGFLSLLGAIATRDNSGEVFWIFVAAGIVNVIGFFMEELNDI
jgi:hypothetical protein